MPRIDLNAPITLMQIVQLAVLVFGLGVAYASIRSEITLLRTEGLHRVEMVRADLLARAEANRERITVLDTQLRGDITAIKASVERIRDRLEDGSFERRGDAGARTRPEYPQ